MVSRTIFIKTNNFRRIRRALLAYVRCGGLALKGLTLQKPHIPASFNMYLVINKWVIAVNVLKFCGQYLRNHWTLVIGVLGYIGIVWPMEHSPEVWSVPPVTLCIVYISLCTLRRLAHTSVCEMPLKARWSRKTWGLACIWWMVVRVVFRFLRPCLLSSKVTKV